MDEEQVDEAGDIEEDGLVIEEQFGKQAQVLTIQLWLKVSSILCKTVVSGAPTESTSPSTSHTLHPLFP